MKGKGHLLAGSVALALGVLVAAFYWSGNAGRTEERGGVGARGPAASAEELLERNGFVVVPERRFEEVVQVYSNLKSQRTPILVTCDSMLHVSHLVFDWYLRFLETAHLRSDLLNLTDAMLAASLAQWDEAEGPEVKEGALLNAAYFLVGKILLGEGSLEDVPEDLRRRIERELELIEAHKGIADSPLFGYGEDYSQYLPRGHYSRSPEFEQYFKAMMWYGRMTFRLPSTEYPETSQTVQALLLARGLREAQVKGESGLEAWRRIYETTGFFAGESDDPTPGDYLRLSDEVFGADCSVDAFGEKERLGEFIERARELSKAKILGSPIIQYQAERAGGWEEIVSGMRLMGQRFSVDGHVMQNMVFDKVGVYEGGEPRPLSAVLTPVGWVRGFPRGLDVLAAFGSETALQILEEERETEYEGYRKQLGEMRRLYEGQGEEFWQGDLGRGWLYCLQALDERPEGEAPGFMREDAWRRKQVNAALGSWTELKHDTIVYAKQPYAMAQSGFAAMSKGGPAPPPPPPVHGYVEPYPEVFGRLAGLMERLKARLTTLGYPTDRGLEANLDRVSGLMRELARIAEKEIAGERPTEEEYDLIENMGSTLARILRFSHYFDVTRDFRSRTDQLVAIVADVHTAPEAHEVLEEAVGRPFLVEAMVPVDGEATRCTGPGYSYYEFRWPMGDRLTDEKWREIVNAGEQAPLPTWTETFIARGE